MRLSATEAKEHPWLDDSEEVTASRAHAAEIIALRQDAQNGEEACIIDLFFLVEAGTMTGEWVCYSGRQRRSIRIATRVW